MFRQNPGNSLSEKIITLPSGVTATFRWINPEAIQWEKYQPIFVDAFASAFEHFSAAELDMYEEDKTKGYHRWFEEEVKSEKKFIENAGKKNIYFLEVEIDNKIIAFSIWHRNQKQPKEIYHSNFCVLRDWQRKGIGTRIVVEIKTLLPELEYFIVDTRKSEKNKANNFYRDHLQCKTCPVMPDETLTNPDNFIGYKGHFSDILQLLNERRTPSFKKMGL